MYGIKATWKDRRLYNEAKRHFMGQRSDPLMAHDDANLTLYLDDSREVSDMLGYLPDGTCTQAKTDMVRALADLLRGKPDGDMICEDCRLPLRECKCENWNGADGDDEPISREDAERDEAVLVRDAELGVYSYAPDGCVAYDVDTPEGASAAHRADMMRVIPANEY